MPNIKFSDFTAEADINNFEGVVGFTTDVGGVNYKIQPLQMPARYDASTDNIALGDSGTLLGTNIGNAGIGNLAIGFGTLNNLNPASGQKLGASLAIGNGALTSITETGPLGTGQQIAIGESAQGVNGSLIGAPNFLSPADENVAIGYNALGSNTGDYTSVGLPQYPGNFNTAIGGRSLEVLDGGGSNTALGHNSGFTLFEGSANTLVGFEVGANATAGISMLNQIGVTAMGWRATSEGDYSVIIGYDAISQNVGTSPDYTINIGYQSRTNTPNTIVIGAQSASLEAPGSIVLGTNSIINLTPPYVISDDVLIGNDCTLSGAVVPTFGATQNTSVGSATTITGSYNTHMGYFADIIGDDNTSIGYFNTVYGNNNCGLGDQSYIGTVGIPANDNIAIGGYTTTAAATSGSILIGIGASNTVLTGALEIGFGGTNVLGSATNDIILIGANGGGAGTSKIELVDTLQIDTGSGILELGDVQVSGPSFFEGPVNIQNTTTAGVNGVVSPDFDGGNIITWTLGGNVTLDNPTITPIAGGSDSGTYIMIINNPLGFSITLAGANYKWPGGPGAFPALSTNTDVITWVSNGTDLYGTITQNFS
tara:strand:+ start:958 stop:2745 length:1788 start_codon:yes stop_codon:yes gene_type:complete